MPGAEERGEWRGTANQHEVFVFVLSDESVMELVVMDVQVVTIITTTELYT